MQTPPNPTPVAITRPTGGSLWIHLVCYIALLSLVVLLFPPDASFTSDDGAYGGQVWALGQQQWSLDRPLAVVDQANEGWFNTSITSSGPIPYTANPAWPTGLHYFAEAFGPHNPQQAGDLGRALSVLPAAGAALGAVAAWLCCSIWDRRSAPMAFWLTALSPVVVNATTLWAHSVSTGLSGIALWLFCLSLRLSQAPSRADSHPSPPRVALRLSTHAAELGTVICLSMLALVRTDGVFWIAGLAVAVAAIDPTRAKLYKASVLLTPGVVVWFTSRWWGATLRHDRLDIATSVEALAPPSGFVAARLKAAWHLGFSATESTMATTLTTLSLLIVAWGAFRLATDRPWSGQILVVGASGYALKTALFPTELISGLLAAWPIVIVILALAAKAYSAQFASRPKGPPINQKHRKACVDQTIPAILVIPTLVVLAAVLATQYRGAGGVQWGGRYLSTLIVPLAVTGALTWTRFKPKPPLANLAIALLATIPSLGGLAASYNTHLNHQNLVEQATVGHPDVVLTDIPALPRLAWPALPVAFYLADDATAITMLEQLAEADVKRVNVFGPLIGADYEGSYQLLGQHDDVVLLELGSKPSP